MPVIATKISSSIKLKIENNIRTKYKEITPELQILLTALSEAVGETVYETLTQDALVTGGVCTPGGAIAGGKIV